MQRLEDSMASEESCLFEGCDDCTVECRSFVQHDRQSVQARERGWEGRDMLLYSSS